MRWIAGIAVATMASTMLSGCGLFSDEGDPGDIIIREDVPVSFSFDASVLCPADDQANCEAGGMTPRDLSLPDVELPAIQIDVLALTGNSELDDAAAELKSVEIESVDYAYKNNTLNSEGPRVVMYMGPLEADARTDSGVISVADIPAAQPMEDTSGTAQVDEENRSKGSDLLKTLKISAIPLVRPADLPQGSEYPNGTVDIDLTLNLKFVANPFEKL